MERPTYSQAGGVSLANIPPGWFAGPGVTALCVLRLVVRPPTAEGATVNRTTQRAIADCDRIIEAMQKTKQDLPELLRRAKHTTRDGYPSSSMGGASQPGGINRPTEAVALSKPMPDPVGQNIWQLVKLLADMARSADTVDGRRRAVLDIGPEDKTPAVELCANTACGAPCLPRARQGRCWPCYEYRRRTGQERPAEGKTG